MFVPEERYKEIIESVPIVCVDIIVKARQGFLLVKRKNDPLKDEFWVIGGRIFLGEKPVTAALRKLFEEAGIECDESDLRFAGVYSDVFSGSNYGASNYHTISLVYLLEVNSAPEVKLDVTSADYDYFETLPQRLIKKLDYSNEF